MKQIEIEKRAIRQQISERRSILGISEKITAEQTICDQLDSMFSRNRYTHIAGYYPLPKEVNIMSVLQAYSNVMALPCITPDNSLVFRTVDDWEALVTNQFSIPEPIHGQPIQPENLEIVIVPGLAFDTSGYRVGRGKGYYDRFLQKLPDTVLRLGVGFSYQVYESLPHLEHDQRIHALLTEKELIQFS